MKLIKLSVFFIILLTTNIVVFSQINVGTNEKVKSDPGEFDEKDLKKLKSTTTIFLYRKDDDIDRLKEAIEPIWNVTDIKFMPHEYIDEIDFDEHSILSISGYSKVTIRRNSKGREVKTQNGYYYLKLWMKDNDEDGNTTNKTFCRIDLHPTFKDFEFLVDKNNKNKVFDYLYTKATLKNWQPGFLKVYLQNVNDLLKNGNTQWLYGNEEKNQNLKNLANETLYVVDYTLVKFNMFSGDESSRHSEKKIMKKYPYNYELLNAEEISDKILESDSKPIYFLVFIKSSTDKYVAIYEGNTGEILYRKYSPISYNFKKNDMKDIARLIQ